MVLSADAWRCLTIARPDVLQYYGLNGWPTTPDYYPEIYTRWFNLLKQLGPDFDEAYKYATVEDYAKFAGCTATAPAPPPVNTSPNSGNLVGPVTTKPKSEFDKVTQFMQQHQVLVMGIAAGLFLLIWKPDALGFGDK